MSEEIKEIGYRTSYLSTPERFSLIILGKLKGNIPPLRIAWALAWVVIGVMVTMRVQQGSFGQDARMVLFVFMVFWAYYLYRIVKTIRWHQVGKEMLMIKDEYLIHKNSFGEIGRSRQYHLANIHPMKRAEKPEGISTLFQDSFWSIGRGTIEIDVDGRILSLGARMDDKEAEDVMRVFNKELKTRRAELD